MSKWAFALAVGIVVAVGCSGGGGSSNASGGGTAGNPGDSTAFVNIPNVPGQFQSVFLTGQGRAAGDLTAVMRRVFINDGSGGIQTLLSPNVRLKLNGYTQNTISLNVPTTVSRAFDHYNLEVQSIDVDNGDGTFSTFGGGNQPLVQATFDAYYRVFPGRQTSLAVRLDDSMFTQNGNTFDFDSNQFITANYSTNGNGPSEMNGFLSDYVMFDISNIPSGEQPLLPDGSANSTIFLINGDNFAVGTKADGPPDQSTADPKPFFVFTPIGYVEGSALGERTAIDPGTGASTIIPGTYSLVQIDPRPPINPASRITAQMGTYKSFNKTISGIGNNPQGFEIIAFPSSLDDGVDDIVLFNSSGGAVSHMYFGQMDMSNGTISAFPIAQIGDPANTANEITGTVSNLVNAGGIGTSDVQQVHSGRYTLAALNLPATFSSAGRFIVYRR